MREARNSQAVVADNELSGHAYPQCCSLDRHARQQLDDCREPPAMEAGLTDLVWSISELLAA